jgi:hypothetical protein
MTLGLFLSFQDSWEMGSSAFTSVCLRFILQIDAKIILHDKCSNVRGLRRERFPSYRRSSQPAKFCANSIWAFVLVAIATTFAVEICNLQEAHTSAPDMQAVC